MRRLPVVLVLTLLTGVSSAASAAPAAKPTLLPPDQEMQLALAAAPSHLRDGAAVYVLEAHGYVKLRDSRNGFSCIVNRDHPLSFKPTCYDTEGSATILPTVLQKGKWLMEGMSQAEIRKRLQEGFASGRFLSPRRPGIAYMLSDRNRFFGGDGRLHAFPPHVMFYAPNLTNKDIGSIGGSDGLPFIAYQGPQGYMLMLVPQKKPTASHHSGHERR